MLLGYPTKYGTGIEIQGDYFDLDSLYNTIHYIVNKLDENPESTLMLSFAYEVRKAKYDFREIVEKGMDETKYKSFKLYWHTYILVTNLMKTRLSSLEENLEHLSNIIRLEAIGRQALECFDLEIGRNIGKWFSQKMIINDIFLEVLNSNLTFELLNEKVGIQRFKVLEKNMNVFCDFSIEREKQLKYFKILAKKNKCKIEDLSLSEDIDEESIKW